MDVPKNQERENSINGNDLDVGINWKANSNSYNK